ncbi:MAG: hypothetical protein P4L79_09970 [Legionella sp.]|uniref:hypothetical protein n=1 Tax=Legionella sp. TaxID=459 RepID=UPI00284CFA5F|nr:hypothetical protein [Legionella sp.]
MSKFNKNTVQMSQNHHIGIHSYNCWCDAKQYVDSNEWKVFFTGDYAESVGFDTVDPHHDMAWKMMEYVHFIDTKFGHNETLPIQPTNDPSDVCPECGAMLLDSPGGGVHCSQCNYWFCY